MNISTVHSFGEPSRSDFVHLRFFCLNGLFDRVDFIQEYIEAFDGNY